jgi:L-rhamnose isomerase
MPTSSDKRIEQAFALASECYAELGVEVDRAVERLSALALSLHCWQGDDVGGFESTAAELGGGLAVTGNYPGKARTPDKLRADLDKTLALIPVGRERGAAGPGAAAATPVRRKSLRETIAAGRVVIGFVMSVLSPGEPL